MPSSRRAVLNARRSASRRRSSTFSGSTSCACGATSTSACACRRSARSSVTACACSRPLSTARRSTGSPSGQPRRSSVSGRTCSGMPNSTSASFSTPSSRCAAPSISRSRMLRRISTRSSVATTTSRRRRTSSCSGATQLRHADVVPRAARELRRPAQLQARTGRHEAPAPADRSRQALDDEGAGLRHAAGARRVAAAARHEGQGGR